NEDPDLVFIARPCPRQSASCYSRIMTAAENLAPDLDLEPTPAEVKRYQRQKLIASLGAMILSLAFLAVMALLVGPELNDALQTRIGDNRWLRLVALAFVYAVSIELLTLPLDFWSGFVLEHRYQLSNQTFLQWIWRQIKGYLVGGPLGLLLLL